MSSRFTHSTVVPFVTVISPGAKLKLSILTSLLAPSLFRSHFVMNGSEVGVSAFFAEVIGKPVVGVERPGLERRLVVAHHGVRDVVAIHPLDGGSLRDRDFTRRKAEIVDLDLAFGALAFQIG